MRAVLRRDVDGQGDLAPVVITKGTLGNARDLTVSPVHRVLVTRRQAETLRGAPEVPVSAWRFARGDRICRAPCARVVTLYILLDRHDIIFAEGAMTESYDLPQGDVDAVNTEKHVPAASDIADLFPHFWACAGGGAARGQRL